MHERPGEPASFILYNVTSAGLPSTVDFQTSDFQTFRLQTFRPTYPFPSSISLIDRNEY